jgi:molybdenum cofactor sulfurtransferase
MATSTLTSQPDPESGYFVNIDEIRNQEYPALTGSKKPIDSFVLGRIYLDHAGTALYARSLVAGFSLEMTANVFGNPHSGSTSSQYSHATT